MPRISQGPSLKGSQKWIQKLVNEKPEMLNSLIRTQPDNLGPLLIIEDGKYGVRGLCLSGSAFSTERVTQVFLETGGISKIVQARPNLKDDIFSYLDRAWLGAPGLFDVSGPRA